MAQDEKVKASHTRLLTHTLYSVFAHVWGCFTAGFLFFQQKMLQKIDLSWALAAHALSQHGHKGAQQCQRAGVRKPERINARCWR